MTAPIRIGSASPFNSTNSGSPNFFTTSNQYDLSTHFSPALGQSAQAGDLMIFVLLSGATAATVSGLTGWTQWASGSVGSSKFIILTHTVTSADISSGVWTVTFNNPAAQFVSMEVVRNVTESPTIIGSLGANTTTTTCTCPDVGTTGAAGNLFSIVAGTNHASNQLNTWSPTQDAILDQAAAGDGRSFAYATRAITASDPGATTATTSGTSTNGDNFGISVFLAAAAAPPAPRMPWLVPPQQTMVRAAVR